MSMKQKNWENVRESQINKGKMYLFLLKYFLKTKKILNKFQPLFIPYIILN